MSKDFMCESSEFNGPKCATQCSRCKPAPQPPVEGLREALDEIWNLREIIRGVRIVANAGVLKDWEDEPWLKRVRNIDLDRALASPSLTAGPSEHGINDQDEILLAYGLLWCVNTTDQRVHAARRELLKCLDRDLQAKAISAARTTLALVRDIRQMKGATFAADFVAEPVGYLYRTEGPVGVINYFSESRCNEYMRNEPWTETPLYAAPALS